ncbi:MAG TPA: YraN family protein [Acidimicrobiia bacterium]
MPSERPPVDRRKLDLGAMGEDLAVAWYTRHGYQVLGRNWRCRDGELDLVVSRDSCVVFCEVKTRSGTGFGLPAEAVTSEKQRRLRRLATRWLGERTASGGFAEVRFDVACVTLRAGAEPALDVIEAAF